MKFLSLILAATALIPSRAFVNEGRYEFTADGDFNGDGLIDSVIVDRATGAFRVGYQNVGGTFTWTDPRASGMENVDSISIGKLFQTTRDALAITSVSGNRVNLFDVPSAASTGVPTSVFIPAIGPNLVIAINIGGTGDTALTDLFIASKANGGANPVGITLIRDNAPTFSVSHSSSTIYYQLRFGNRLFFKKTGPEFAGAIDRDGFTDQFLLFSPTNNIPNPVLVNWGVAGGSSFISGNFSGALFNHLVFFRSGAASFFSHPTSETAGVYSIGAGVEFNLGQAISQLITLPGATADRLFAIFDDGTAAVYNFNGSSAPTLIQKVLPDPGEKITGVLPTSNNNDFIAFSGAGNVSTAARQYKVAGGVYVAGSKSSLPALTPLSGDANVFLFSQEPFVSGAPGLLRSLSAGDWTSDLTVVSGPPATFAANVWNFEGGALGLRNPVNVNFGAVASTPTYGLVNQYAPSISLFSRAPAVGDEIVEVKISPEPGEFLTAIKVTLTSPVPLAQLWYRLSPTAAWTLYTTPFTLFKTTPVEYYGAPLGSSLKSRIHTATYTFPNAPGAQDSDRDGVPDFVEIARGLNPNGGKDQDGDGFTDLNELVAGTDPLNAASVPTDAQRLEEKSAFHLFMGLRPLNGLTGLQTTAALGVNLRSYDLFGNILRANVSSNLGIAGVTDPAVWHTNILQLSDPPVFVAATDQHFDINVAGSDKALGRELLSIIPVPRPPQPPVVYNYNTNGAPSTEAANWIAAAQSLYASLPHEVIKDNLEINDTLIALLFERKISKILFERGNPAWSNLTLFPFRPTDSGRTNPPAALLRTFSTRLDDTHPAYLLNGILIGLSNAVNSGLPSLKTLTSEIYRISSASNNAAPGKYPSPVDVLRTFLETGSLQSNYLAGIIGPIDLVATFNAANAALNAITGRPTVNLDLVIRPDTFTGSCTILNTASGPVQQKALLHPGGNQYRLLEAFNLVPGSHVHVFGYTDVTSACTGAGAIEVISIALDSVPETTAIDTDGDLLLDSLELLLFGSLSNTGLGDFDGDGYSNLQEILDGTDAADGVAHGLAIANLSPPSLTITTLAGGQILLTFDFPAAYFDDLHFAVKSTTTLGAGFTDEGITPTNTGGNHFQVLLPNPGVTHKFYQLSMSVL